MNYRIFNKIIFFIVLFFLFLTKNVYSTIKFYTPYSSIVLNSEFSKFAAPNTSTINGWFNQNLIRENWKTNLKDFDIYDTLNQYNAPSEKFNDFIYNDLINKTNSLNINNKTLFFDTDISIPDNTIFTLTSNGVINGCYKNLILGKNSQILLDNNVSVTFKNIIFKNNSNTIRPTIKCNNNSGIITFDNSTFSFNETFTFERGHMFINNEVNFTGTSEFIYNSINTSYILPHSSLNFKPQTTFIYAPYSTNNNLIIMNDKSSCLKFDNSSLKITHTGLRLTHGSLYFDNKITISSTHETFNNALIFGNLTLGSDYDLSTYILSGSRINLDGRIVLENTLNAQNSLDFASRNSSIILANSRSKLKITNNEGIYGYQEQSIIKTDGNNNTWISDNTIYGFDSGEIDPVTYLVYNNSNAIVSQSNRIRWNSNAIISNDLLDYEQQIIYNSNAIINLEPKIINNSNAIIHDYEIKTDLQNQIKHNSDAIINNNQNINQHSNAIINQNNQINQNSNTIINNSYNIHYNSQAILHDYEIKTDLQNQIKYNSDAILKNNKMINWNSDVILSIQTAELQKAIKYNSDAIINQESATLLQDIKNNSNAIINIEPKVHNNSQAIIHDYEIKQNLQEQIRHNSEAIVNSDSAIVQEKIRHNSEAIINYEPLKRIKYNSNSIIKSNIDVKYNSQAILHDYEITDSIQNIITYNSNAILNALNTPNLEDQIRHNSDAILEHDKKIYYNSNGIIKISQGSTAAGLQSQIDTINSNISGLEDEIALLQAEVIQAEDDAENSSTRANTQSSTLDTLSDDIDALAEKVINNSNAIVTHEREITQNSNSIVKNRADIDTTTLNIAANTANINTNTLNINQNTETIKNNSNAIVTHERENNWNISATANIEISYLSKQNNSAIIVEMQKASYLSSATINNNIFISYNSNAIINKQLLLEPLQEKIKHNSDAIINLDATSLQEEIKHNSDAIINIALKTSYNSQAILHDYEIKQNLQDQIRYNSNFIINNTKDALELKIKHNSDAIINFNPTEQETILTQAPITTDLNLNDSVFIHPNQRIFINGNVTINGNGAVIIFGGTNHSQFVVAPNKTVTLKNIQLLRINQNSFDLRYRSFFDNTKATKYSLENSCVKIEENVLFGLSENITVSQGLIEIINNINNQAQTFYLKGIEGQKEFKLAPTDDYANALSKADNGLTWIQRKAGITGKLASVYPDLFTQNATIPVLLKCNDNTFAIQNIILSGFEHITKTNSTNYSGATALLGETNINIGDETFTEFEKNKNVQESYNMNFIIQDLNNKLILIKDDLKFTGQLNFSDFGENELYIQTALTEKIAPKLGSNDYSRTIPQINFGTNFMNINSDFGTAKLIFEDLIIRVNNAINGFTTNKNSKIIGDIIEITGDPIRNNYEITSNAKYLEIFANKLIGLDDINDKPIIKEDLLCLKDLSKTGKNSLDLIYEQELSKFLKIK